MKLIEGDLMGVPYGAVVGHQVNCRGVMGGLAGTIARVCPDAAQEYRDYVKLAGDAALGECLLCESRAGFYVAHLFGQVEPGPNTDYSALHSSLERLAVVSGDLPVYLPELLGCGMGGGDWAVVEGLIRFALPGATLVRYKPVEIK